MALVHEHLLQRGQHALDVDATERLRPPRHAQAYAEGRFVCAVPADVADHEVHGAVRRVHQVVEVPSEERPLAAGAIPGADEQRRVVEDRHGQQPALQARGLLGQDLGGPQLLADAVGLAPFNGVDDRPAQAVAAEAALDDVVLGARRHGIDAALVVAISGEHEVRQMRGRLAQALQGDEPAGVRQAEVEQDAVEGLRREQREPLGERLRTVDLDRRSLLAQQLADQEGVAVVVLDEQHPDQVARHQA